MEPVFVSDVGIVNNDCNFMDPFQFEITFQVRQEIQEDLEWKVIYVGSAENKELDQELDCVMVGPVSLGENKFTLETPAPDYSKIPKNEVLGVTVLLVTCSYRGNEFTRIGYYVNNDYSNLELRDNPPAEIDSAQVVRSILVAKPHVTTFPIVWDAAPAPEPASCSSDAMQAMGDGVSDVMSAPMPTEAN